MRIHNLYADEAGESHFRDLEIDWAQTGPGGRMSEMRPATGIIFRETAGDYRLGWHTAPRRQYIINLDAPVEITASDGESRVIQAGEVLLVEDVRGRGHLSRAVDGKPRRSIFVAID